MAYHSRCELLDSSKIRLMLCKTETKGKMGNVVVDELQFIDLI